MSGSDNEIVKTKKYIQYLESELSVAQAYLKGLLFDNSQSYGNIINDLKGILQEAANPLHIDKILDLLAIPEEEKLKKKLSMRTMLNSYCRKGKIFTKVGKNVFGLKEWG